MPDIDPVLVIKAAGYGGFLWLGIYIVSRAAVQTYLTIISMIGLLVMAAFLFSSAIIGNNSTPLGLQGGVTTARSFWWTDVMPMAFWFHMTSLVARRNRSNPVFTWLVAALYLAGLAISVVGTFTDVFLDYTNTSSLPGNRWYTDVGRPGYLVFIFYMIIGGAGALFNLWLALRDMMQSNAPNKKALGFQLKLLMLGGLLFAGGGLLLTTNFYFGGTSLMELSGNLCLLLGLGFLGYGITHFDMLVEGQNVQRDFVYSLVGMTLTCIIYVILLSLTGANSTLNILVLIGVAIISHSTFDYTRGLLDKLFFSHPEQTARAEARAYAVAIGSQPAPVVELTEAIATPAPSDPVETEAEPASSTPASSLEETNVNEKGFNDMVRRAITGLKSPPQMIKSPLLSLHLVERRLHENSLEDNRLNRAAALRELLIERIERLRPAGLEETSGTGDAWRFYNVLYYPYVREISRKSALSEVRRLQDARRRNGQREPGELERVLEWLVDVDEDTFYKWQRKASDTLASILREEELKLQGHIEIPSAVEAK